VACAPLVGCSGRSSCHLDALAAEGTIFPYAFATTASCSPSRSVILTGLHNHRTAQYGLQHAVHHFTSYANLQGLPVLLAKAGYRAARVGKYHVAPEDVYRFDEVIPGPERNPVQLAENAALFIEANRSRPFFLYFATSDPHRSGDPSVAGAERPAGATIGVPDGFGNRAQGRRRYKLIWNLAHGIPFPFAADLWRSAAWQGVYQPYGMEARYGMRTAREYMHRPEYELYDMEADPFESTNLADSPQHAVVLQEYKDKIRAFQQRTSDPWLVEWGRRDPSGR
jgi:arylsulfatase A-like enzyme